MLLTINTAPLLIFPASSGRHGDFVAASKVASCNRPFVAPLAAPEKPRFERHLTAATPALSAAVPATLILSAMVLTVACR